MTHIFIVNDKTFDIHLKYMFAATGTDNTPIFLNNPKDINIHHSTERNLLGLIADISRVKENDNILFYLQANKYHYGTIFGIFKAISNPFYCADNYLQNELQKNLQYRVLIAPYEVYTKGISEYTALDSLADIEHPSQMCWSLIYRKLRGNRGCTMITDYEADRLKKLIMNLKDNNIIQKTNKLSYNLQNNCISTNQIATTYNSKNKSDLNIKEQLCFKIDRNQAYEIHLQAYILQNINQDNKLKQLIIPNTDNPFWIGNEVGCSVGMQKIDILIMQHINNTLYINIIELKCTKPNKTIFKQLEKYINWIKDYICPLYSDNDIIINPIIIAPFDTNNLLLNISNENNHNKIKIMKIKYINITKCNDHIVFKELS